MGVNYTEFFHFLVDFRHFSIGLSGEELYELGVNYTELGADSTAGA